MWQVCGWTAEQIGAEVDNAPKRGEAIMAQVRWAAKMIELKLRKPTGQGRRPRDRQ